MGVIKIDIQTPKLLDLNNYQQFFFLFSAQRTTERLKLFGPSAALQQLGIVSSPYFLYSSQVIFLQQLCVSKLTFFIYVKRDLNFFFSVKQDLGPFVCDVTEPPISGSGLEFRYSFLIHYLILLLDLLSFQFHENILTCN